MEILFLIVAIVSMSTATSVSDDSGTGSNISSSINTLLQLGLANSKALLDIQTKLLNKEDIVVAVVDVLGQAQCTDWSEWSRCRVDHEATIVNSTRSRICSTITGAVCPSSIGDETNRTETESTETESKPCAMTNVTCPTYYTRTKHGFCLKYNARKLDNTQAMSACKKHGGHLVNINSRVKSDDVDEFLTSMGSYGHVIIDGYREHLSPVWEYSYGPSPQSVGFSNWNVGRGEPDYRYSDLRCLLDVCPSRCRSRVWATRACKTVYRSVCEYV